MKPNTNKMYRATLYDKIDAAIDDLKEKLNLDSTSIETKQKIRRILREVFKFNEQECEKSNCNTQTKKKGNTDA